MMIWRVGGWYEGVDVIASWSNRKDWEKVQAWAAQIWPQPPAHTHRSAVIE